MARVDCGLRAGLVVAVEIFPGQKLAVFAILLAVVGREVRPTEIDVRLREATWVEALLVRLAGVDSTGAPAWVYEFPVAVVEAAGVPSVVRLERWDSVLGSLLFVVSTFARARNDNGFQAYFCSESGEQTGVAFADCQT